MHHIQHRRQYVPFDCICALSDFRNVLRALPDASQGFIALVCGDFVASVQAGPGFYSHPRDDAATPFAFSEWEVALYHDTPQAPWVTPESAPWLFTVDTPWFPYLAPSVSVFALRYAPVSVVEALLRALTSPSHDPREDTSA